MPELTAPPTRPAAVSETAETVRLAAGAVDTDIDPADLMPDVLDLVSDAEPAEPAVGDRLGSYVLRERLGSGASCHVFRGWDEDGRRPVAVKVVNWANVYDRPAALKQMRTEAVALARVRHPRVLRFLDFGFDARWPYLVTECVDGRSLGELLRTGGGLPVEWVLYLMSQVTDALGAVWKAGLVHRDIKPDNVLVGPDGDAKLIDFGLAKAPVLRATVGHTGPELAGTAAYLAPEQARDASVVDLRADVYSLGVTFYEALTGRLPFDGKNRTQMIFHHLGTRPVPPADRVPAVPQVVSDLCLWMLAKSPDERPQSYQELRDAFDVVRAG